MILTKGVLLGVVLAAIAPQVASAQWTGWSQVPGNGMTTDSPSAVVTPESRDINVFVRGTDNGIYWNSYHTEGTNATKWSGWRAVPGGWRTLSAPATTVFGSKLYVFVRGTNNGIYYTSMVTQTGQWDRWREWPGGGRTTSAPDVTGSSDEGGYTNLNVFIRGTNDRIYRWSTSPSSAGWREVPGNGRTIDAPAASAYFPGQLSLFVRGTTNGIFWNSAGSGGWTGWRELPGGWRTTSAPEATRQPGIGGSTIDVWVRGTDNGVWATTQRAVGWYPWSQLPGGGRTLSAPSVARIPRIPSTFVFVRGTDNRIYWNRHP